MDSAASSSNSALFVVATVVAIGIGFYLFTNMGCNNSVHAETKKESTTDQQQAEKSKSLSSNSTVQQPEQNKYPNGPLRIYFGSQTGTAEGFARSLMQEGRKKGFDAQLVDCAEFDPDELADTTLALFLMATYGEGDPTDNAAKFVTFLKDKERELSENFLSKMRFSVFGLGNKQYEHYNAMGKLVNTRLEALGAARAYEYGEGDDDNALEDDFEKWRSELWPAMLATTSATNQNANSNNTEEVDQKVSLEFDIIEIEDNKDSTTRGVELTSTPTIEKNKTLRSSTQSTMRRAAITDKLAQRSKHLMSARAELVEKRELRPNSNSGSTLHLEIDLHSAKLHYLTADNLAVVPENDSTIVERFANRVNLTELNQVVEIVPREGESHSLPFPSPVKLIDLLTQHVDLQGSVSLSIAKALIAYVENKDEREWLRKITHKDARNEFKQVFDVAQLNIVSLLESKLSSANISLTDLLHLLPSIQPRFYTISSSSLVQPHQCSITVGIIEDKSTGFKGQCTGFLQRLSVHDHLRVFVRESTFRLPASLSTPIILIGPGTGLAPMRALAHERRAQSQRQEEQAGECALFFGCRRSDEDYIYREELEQLQRDGAISHFFTAFSREDANKKVYVQHRIAEQGEMLSKWITERHAHVYVCGATAMGHDVHTTLESVLVKHANMSEADAQNMLKNMQHSGKYVQELWSAN